MLTVVTPPAIEPVSVAAFRRDRRLDALADDDTESAAYVDSLRTIAAARGHVEQYTRRALIRRELRLATVGAWVPTPLQLWQPPVLEVTRVLVDGVEAAPSTYELDELGQLWSAPGGVNRFGTQWLTASGYARRVVVEYAAGYGPAPSDVPPDLVQAVLRIAGDLWETREDAIVGTVVGKAVQSAAVLMDPYRVPLL